MSTGGSLAFASTSWASFLSMMKPVADPDETVTTMITTHDDAAADTTSLSKDNDTLCTTSILKGGETILLEENTASDDEYTGLTTRDKESPHQGDLPPSDAHSGKGDKCVHIPKVLRLRG